MIQYNRGGAMIVEWSIVILVVAFICLDIITGLLKAVYEKNLESECIRKGLIHKIGEILAVAVAFLIEYSQTVILSINFDIPIVKGVCIYIILMEILSVLENICVINPQLRKVFSPYLKKLREKENEIESKGN